MTAKKVKVAEDRSEEGLEMDPTETHLVKLGITTALKNHKKTSNPTEYNRQKNAKISTPSVEERIDREGHAIKSQMLPCQRCSAQKFCTGKCQCNKNEKIDTKERKNIKYRWRPTMDDEK